MNKRFSNFLFPSFNRKFIFRVCIVGIVAFIFFGYICIPIRIQGHSMEPTYRDGTFNFCFTLKYHFFKPQRFDVVFIRFSGKKVMLLKRLIAFEGETVEIRKGLLYINGQLIDEPHIIQKGDWILPERQVEKNHVYVIGDNRTVPMAQHDFGQVSIQRIIGVPVW